MKLMPLGDYYVWYCEWCDSRNLTLWTRFEHGAVRCGACHHTFAGAGHDPGVVERSLAKVI